MKLKKHLFPLADYVLITIIGISLGVASGRAEDRSSIDTQNLGVLEVILSPEQKTIRILGLPPGAYPVVLESAQSSIQTETIIMDNQVSSLVLNFPADVMLKDVDQNILPDSYWVDVTGGSYVRQKPATENDRRDGLAETVTVSSFSLGKVEVTNAQFCAFLNACDVSQEEASFLIEIEDHFCRISHSGETYVCQPEFEDHPVLEVTWHGAQAFCSWVGGRLPSVAEWEFAASERGKPVLYGNGMNQADISAMNFNNKKDPVPRRRFLMPEKQSTTPVGHFAPNELGLYDMSGNVWEWCLDSKLSQYSPLTPKDIYTYCPSCSHVIKGGSYSSHADNCQITALSTHASCSGCGNIGFRVCRGIPKNYSAQINMGARE